MAAALAGLTGAVSERGGEGAGTSLGPAAFPPGALQPSPLPPSVPAAVVSGASGGAPSSRLESAAAGAPAGLTEAVCGGDGAGTSLGPAASLSGAQEPLPPLPSLPASVVGGPSGEPPSPRLESAAAGAPAGFNEAVCGGDGAGASLGPAALPDGAQQPSPPLPSRPDSVAGGASGGAPSLRLVSAAAGAPAGLTEAVCGGDGAGTSLGPAASLDGGQLLPPPLDPVAAISPHASQSQLVQHASASRMRHASSVDSEAESREIRSGQTTQQTPGSIDSTLSLPAYEWYLAAQDLMYPEVGPIVPPTSSLHLQPRGSAVANVDGASLASKGGGGSQFSVGGPLAAAQPDPSQQQRCSSLAGRPAAIVNSSSPPTSSDLAPQFPESLVASELAPASRIRRSSGGSLASSLSSPAPKMLVASRRVESSGPVGPKTVTAAALPTRARVPPPTSARNAAELEFLESREESAARKKAEAVIRQQRAERRAAALLPGPSAPPSSARSVHHSQRSALYVRPPEPDLFGGPRVGGAPSSLRASHLIGSQHDLDVPLDLEGSSGGDVSPAHAAALLKDGSAASSAPHLPDAE